MKLPAPPLACLAGVALAGVASSFDPTAVSQTALVSVTIADATGGVVPCLGPAPIPFAVGQLLVFGELPLPPRPVSSSLLGLPFPMFLTLSDPFTGAEIDRDRVHFVIQSPGRFRVAPHRRLHA